MTHQPELCAFFARLVWTLLRWEDERYEQDVDRIQATEYGRSVKPS